MSGFIYILLFISLLLVLIIYNNEHQTKRDIQILAPFSDKWANKLHQLSYTIPFIWFIDEKEESPKTKDIKEKIAEANLGHKFNSRSFTTLKVGLLMLSILTFLFLLIIINNGQEVARILFNIQPNSTNIGNSADSLQKIKSMTFMVLIGMCLAPNIILKRRASVYKYHYLKDIPVVQLFIILMLRSKKPVSEVLYALSKINTRYKGVFEIGYRIYLRDKNEGFNYIEESFGQTKFKETINVLRDLGDYSREESVKLLENNMQQIIDYNNSLKRRGDLSKLVYSQSTIAIPFVAIIVLCFVPLAVFGIQIFQGAGMGFM